MFDYMYTTCFTWTHVAEPTKLFHKVNMNVVEETKATKADMQKKTKTIVAFSKMMEMVINILAFILFTFSIKKC